MSITASSNHLDNFEIMSFKSPNEEFYKELFSVYDQQNTGYITVEKFISITRENMAENWAVDEDRVERIKKSLDPFESGKIDFDQFVIGIQKLTNEDDQQIPQTDNNNLIDTYADLNWNNIQMNPADSTNLTKHHTNLMDKSSIDFFDGKSNESSLSHLNDTYNEYDTSHSKKSTSNYSTSSMRNDDNLLDFNLFDLANSKNSTDSLLNTNSEDESKQTFSADDEDPFGFGLEQIQTHRKTLINANAKDGEINSTNRRASELYNTSITDNKLISSIEDDLGSEKDTYETDEKNYDELKEEQIIEKLEEKVNMLKSQNESLINEKNELTCTINKMNAENVNLYEKIREFEEINLEQERKIQILTDENFRLTENLNRATLSLQEEIENHLVQKSNLEKTLSNFKEENSKYLKVILEINKNIEINDKKLNDETEKYHELEKSFQNLIKEKEILKKDNEQLIANHFEKVNSLTDELNEAQTQLDMLNQRQRSTTVLDQISSNTLIKELENEIEKLRVENSSLNITIEELNAQIMKYNIENGHNLANTGMKNSHSFAAELGKASNEDKDLLELYKIEQENSKRLQNYIDDIISTIMDHNPEILEINLKKKKERN